MSTTIQPYEVLNSPIVRRTAEATSLVIEVTMVCRACNGRNSACVTCEGHLAVTGDLVCPNDECPCEGTGIKSVTLRVKNNDRSCEYIPCDTLTETQAMFWEGDSFLACMVKSTRPATRNYAQEIPF